jgi:hypothetical protein
MVDAALRDELLEHLDHLSPAMQRHVLDLVRSMASPIPKSTPGDLLLRLAGTISDEDADEMTRAIERGCEWIDHDEW